MARYERLSQTLIDAIVSMYKKGTPVIEICKELRLDEVTVHKYLTLTGTREIPEYVSVQSAKRIDKATEDRIIELYKSGMEVKRMVAELDLSADTLYRHLRRQGLSRQKDPQVYADAIEQVVKHKRKVPEVAEEYGISPSTLYRKRKDMKAKGLI